MQLNNILLALAALTTAANAYTPTKVPLTRVKPLREGLNAHFNTIGKRDHTQKLAFKESAFQYLGEVEFGADSKQKFNLVFDTGSSDTWVRGSTCHTYPGRDDSQNKSCDGPKIDVTKPDIKQVTFPQNGSAILTPFEYYGTQGNDPLTAQSVLQLMVYRTQINIADATTVTNIGVGDTMDGFSDSFDGILGLGFDGLSNISQELADAGVSGTTDGNYIDDLPADIPKLFSIYISGNQDGDVGEFVVGGIDQSRVIGDFTYLNVVKELWWTINLQGATVSLVDSTGNKVVDKLAISSQKTKYAIVDSGTPGIVLQDDIANSLVKTLKQMDCQKMPTLTVSIGGNDFNVAPEYYVYQNGDGTCDPLIFPGGTQLSIFGSSLMQAYYTVFDKVNKR
ncbi:hypothetical protein HDU76_009640, partial [Blyttiomyces sp. JEL0837]